jgi:tetratricopeptide (TPR) repeat protein
MFRKCTFFAFTVLLMQSFLVTGQVTIKELTVRGDQYMRQERFDKAIKCFEKCYELKPKERSIKESLAFAYFEGSQIQNALRLYNSLVVIDGYDSPKNLLYFAKSFHHTMQYKEAATYYKKYLAKVKDNEPNREAILEDLKRCSTGTTLAFENPNTIVENLGENINTPMDEYAPVFSPNSDAKIYFTSNRETVNGGLRNKAGVKDEASGTYATDMMMSELDNGEWQTAKPLNHLLNSPKNDILMDFTKNGKVAVFKKGISRLNGQIFTDTFKTEHRDLVNPKLVTFLPMVGEKGDKDLFFINDTAILFASLRDGGYGGYDLYLSLFSKGKWKKAENLGPAINSKYDEIAPYLADDGKTLFFSSNSINSIGGFDIFNSTFDDFTYQWKQPVNQGVPINSTANDMYFRFAKSGNYALLSSDRKTGWGGIDLYSCLFQNSMANIMTAGIPGVFYLIKDYKEGKYIPPKSKVKPEPPTMDTRMEQDSITFSGQLIDSTRTIGEDSSAVITESGEIVEGTSRTNPAQSVDNTVAFVKEFTLSPVFYSDKEKLEFNKNNIEKLDAIFEIMKLDTNMRLNITAHTELYGSRNFSLYSGMKMSELAGNYLIAKGLSADKIFLRSLGDNYPESKNVLNGKTNVAAKWLNKRLDLTLHNIKNPYLHINYDFPAVSDLMKDIKGRSFQQAQEGVSYKVQFASLKQMYSGNLLESKSDPMVERIPNIPYYRYSIGFFKKFQDAEAYRETLLVEGLKDAYVIAYLDGIKITSDMVNGELVRKYPDLKLFFKLGE